MLPDASVFRFDFYVVGTFTTRNEISARENFITEWKP